MGGLQFTKSHEWILFDEDENTAKIGISDYAQEELGDIVFVNLPEIGDSFDLGDVVADIESVKAVSDIYSPIAGVVKAINEELLDSPEIINEDPHEAWFIEFSDVTETEDFLTEDEYNVFVKGGGE